MRILKRIYVDENCEIVHERFLDVIEDALYYSSEGKRIVPISKIERLLTYGDDLCTAEFFSFDMEEVEMYELFLKKITEKTKYETAIRMKEIEKLETDFYNIVLRRGIKK